MRRASMAERLLWAAQLLLRDGKVTTGAIRRKFGVSTATANRDIRDLVRYLRARHTKPPARGVEQEIEGPGRLVRKR